MPTKSIAALLVAMSLVAPALAETGVGVSVGIYQPGVYGRIDIGSHAPPPVVYRQPILMVQPPVALRPEPVYLYVPSSHRRHWAHHCGSYGACGQPVYFVQERWVRERYEQRQHPGQGKAHGKGHNG